MTKLLLSVCNRKDAAAGIASGTDILDIVADDSKVLSWFTAMAQSLAGKSSLSMTLSLPFFVSCHDHPALKPVSFFRIYMNETPQKADWDSLKQFYGKYKIILLINAAATDFSVWAGLIKQAQASGLYGVMLDIPVNSMRLIRQHMMADIGKFVDEARHNGLAAGLAGALEAPDVPRLLPYSPDLLGFEWAQIAKVTGRDTPDNWQLIRSLVPCGQDMAGEEYSVPLGTDRIVVSDFILPMQIGVYHHEHNREQRVCFNVAVDVTRVCVNPEDMRHIFSYDLILDGIRTLVTLGHIDLVETLAERIAAFILAFPRVQNVMVRVEKLDLGPRAVGVEILRTKKR